jgi:hypothetical protein
MKKRNRLDDPKLEIVRNTSVTRLEVAPPSVIELMPSYEVTIENLEIGESIEIEIWQENSVAEPISLGFVIVAKPRIPKEHDSIIELWI